jgi:tripartite ATP-independent transporter DctM subunit
MTTAVLVLIISFIILLALNVPVAFCMGISTLLAMLTIPEFPAAVAVAHNIATGIDSFALLAIPFFILSGLFMGHGGIARRLIDFANVLVGGFRGGLAFVNILTCMLFGAISGSAAAAVSSVGGFMIPLMNKMGYHRDFNASVTITAATTGLLIPPSNVMIVYSLATGGAVSIAAIFIAGVIPGILVGLALMVVAGLISAKQKYGLETEAGFIRGLVALAKAAPAILVLAAACFAAYYIYQGARYAIDTPQRDIIAGAATFLSIVAASITAIIIHDRARKSGVEGYSHLSRIIPLLLIVFFAFVFAFSGLAGLFTRIFYAFAAEGPRQGLLRMILFASVLVAVYLCFWLYTKYESARCAVHAILPLLLIVIVLGGILGGIFTATEASAVAVLYSFILAVFVYREVKLAAIPKILLQCGVTTAVVFMLIGTSMAMSWFLASESIPQNISAGLLSITSNKFLLLLLINALLLVVGTVMDMTPAVLIFTPIFLPVVTRLFPDTPPQYTALYFGIIMIMNLCIGLCTPPVGTCLFLGCGIAQTSVTKIMRHILPFFIAMIAILLLCTYVPWFSLTLPRALGLLK